MLQYGYEHFVKIEPIARFLDVEVAETPMVLIRNYLFINNGPLSLWHILTLVL
jgi:hypothetical protein